MKPPDSRGLLVELERGTSHLNLTCSYELIGLNRISYPGTMALPVILALERLRQDDQKFKLPSEL